MPENKKSAIQVLHPAYYTRFSCIGNACEDHCCKDWAIIIDRATYKKYRRLNDPRFEKAIRRLRVDANDGNYAAFQLDENGLCPFFDDDGLCYIQKNYGGESLCMTCRSYPRIPNMFQEGIHEFSMYMTCPEIVRVALFSPDPMTFQLSEMDSGMSSILKGRGFPNLEDPDMFGQSGKYAWEIREACIDLLQNRSNQLSNRIFSVGMLLHKLTELCEAEAFDKVPGAIRIYQDMAKAGQFVDTLQSVPDNPTIKVDMKLILIHYILEKGAQNATKSPYTPMKKFATISATWLHNQTGEMQVSYAQLYEYVERCMAKNWEGCMSAYGHVLENYFVNLVFSRQALFKYPALTLYQHFIILAEQYAIIKMLVSVLMEETPLDDSMINDIIRMMARDAMHNSTAKHIIEAYHTAERDTPAHISFLLQ